MWLMQARSHLLRDLQIYLHDQVRFTNAAQSSAPCSFLQSRHTSLAQTARSTQPQPCPIDFETIALGTANSLAPPGDRRDLALPWLDREHPSRCHSLLSSITSPRTAFYLAASNQMLTILIQFGYLTRFVLGSACYWDFIGENVLAADLG